MSSTVSRTEPVFFFHWYWEGVRILPVSQMTWLEGSQYIIIYTFQTSWLEDLLLMEEILHHLGCIKHCK